MTDPREEKTHRKRGARQEEEKERSRKRPTQRNQKGTRRTRKEEQLRKPQKVYNCLGPQREDPVTEGTGDSTEAEELPETYRKNQEQEGQAEKRQETSQKNNHRKARKKCNVGNPREGNTTQSKHRGEPLTRKKTSGKGDHV